MAKFIIGILCGVSAIVLAQSLFFDRQLLEVSGLATNCSVDVGSRVEVKKEGVEHLLGENLALRKEVERLKQLTNKSISTSAASSVSDQFANKFTALLNAQAQQKDLENYLRANPGVDIGVTAKTAFDREEVDSEWSAEYQQKLEAYFQRDRNLAELSFRSIECRKAHCKVSIAAADMAQVMKYSDLFKESINNNQENIARTILFAPDASNGELSFYLARDENAKLFQ